MRLFRHTLLSGLFTLIVACLPAALIAQKAPYESEAVYSPYQDPIFYALVAIVIILLVFILQLQRVFASVVREYSRGKIGNHGNKLPMIALLIGLTVAPDQLFAAYGEPTFIKHAFGSNAINSLFFLILVELAVVLYYVRLIRSFTEKPFEDKPYVEVVRTQPSFWDRFNQSVTVEKEATIMTDHEYDGIRELDNALPPWWKYGFYLTIIWSVFYLAHYHVAKSGPSSLEEYAMQMEAGERAVAEYVSRMGNLVDETNVKMLTELSELEKGKEIFMNLCASCHGKLGEGQIGPNMTDAYWKHGGGISDLFKVVKYGVSGTGMKSWKDELSPSQMATVSSYILTLQGTNPPNPKAPEGQFYIPQEPAEEESTEADTLNVAVAQ